MISQTFTFIDRRGNSPVYLQKWNYPHVSSAQTDVREGEQSFSSGVCRLVSLGPFIVRGRVTRTNVFLSFLMVFWRATDLSRTDQTGCPGTSSRWASFTRVWRSFNDGIVCMWRVCVFTHTEFELFSYCRPSSVWQHTCIYSWCRKYLFFEYLCNINFATD